MVADLSEYVTCGISSNVSANMVCYADDFTLYASSKSVNSLHEEIEKMSQQMLSYCKKVGLIINEDKTQMLVSGVK